MATGSHKENSILLEFIEKTVNSYVAFGGELVSDDHYNERVSICNGCDQKGEVVIPLPFIKLKTIGCRVCKCPLTTKPRAKKYFSLDSFSIVDMVCPHKDGDKWSGLDKKYL